jgi:hypothetical protein
MDSSQTAHRSRRDFLKTAVLSGVGLTTAGLDLQSAGTNVSEKPLVLAKLGKSTYSIVISKEASPSERRAAGELQRFIEEISGARLPITTDAGERGGAVVLVGDSIHLRELGVNIPYDQLGPEGFVLRTVGDNLIIAGGKQRGTLYGVTTFLDKLGCRWFTSEVSVIPKKPTLVVEPLNELQKPAFEYREPFFAEAADKDWAARNRVNGSSQRLDESTGGKVSYYPFVHSFYTILPPQQYFPDHPEYYALVDGRRRSEDAQLCLTNPDVLRLTIQTVLKWIDEHPEASIFSVSQNDTTGWCECEACQRIEQEEGGAHSGPILRFVNTVATEVGKKHPDKLIDTLAYWYSQPPPAKVRPFPNVRIRLCPIGVCEGHAYERCVHDQYFLNDLQAWAKITDQLYIWHYVTDFAHYLAPFPDFDELAADVPMYKQHGVVGIFMEGDGSPGGENAELRSYVLARLLWNPQVDVDRTINEFMDACYGRAARAMRAYFDLQHRQVRLAPPGKGHHLWIYTSPGAPYLSQDFLAQAAKLFDEAETAATDDATRERVRKARLAIDYVKVMRAKKFAVREGWYAPEHLDELQVNFRRLLTNSRSFGIPCWHEGTLLEDDERDFAKRIKPYRVVTLESSGLRMVVAPELSGRIIAIVDKATGTDIIHHPDPADRGYPDIGGLGVFVHPDYLSRAPYDATWELAAQTGPNELQLTGTYSNGLTIRNNLRLAADKPDLHTETTLENRGSSSIDAVICSRCSLGLDRPEELRVSFGTQAGKTVEQALFPAGQEPSGSQWYAGSDQPDGEWSLQGVRTQIAVINRFRKEQVGRCSLNWTGKAEAQLTLGLWSANRTLAPGETLELAGDYEVSRIRL